MSLEGWGPAWKGHLPQAGVQDIHTPSSSGEETPRPHFFCVTKYVLFHLHVFYFTEGPAWIESRLV